MSDPVIVSRTIAAPPDRVWEMVSDLPRMGDWSPENTGGSWVKGATGPAAGARFKGTNANGKKQWSTDVKVTTCEPGRAFAFDVTAVGFSVATWAYTIESAPEGCVVTESWTDNRGLVARTLGGMASGVSDRADFNRSSMEMTLAALAGAAEGS